MWRVLKLMISTLYTIAVVTDNKVREVNIFSKEYPNEEKMESNLNSAIYATYGSIL